MLSYHKLKHVVLKKVLFILYKFIPMLKFASSWHQSLSELESNNIKKHCIVTSQRVAIVSLRKTFQDFSQYIPVLNFAQL